MDQTTHDPRVHIDRIVDTLLDSVRRVDMRTFADQWAPDGVMEFPFAPPNYPVLHGRDAVWDYVKDYGASFRIDEVTEHRRHHTTDASTVIVEFSAKGVVRQTGNDYTMDYIGVITVGPDGIEHYRDYWNSLAAVSALGGVDALRTAFGVDAQS
ncbi:nuclear transport factor 2 family protein [Mycolicibacterium sp.]|uniref:nuclear transport factor 2 family protein n=1 Tax=Mycolicibacterium sp. TaxID=2320850 RepID=UPI003D0BF51D